MTTVQWRTERNVLTTPPSHRIRFVPRNIFGYQGLAAELVRDNPTWNQSLVEAILRARDAKIKTLLINGNQVTLEDAFVYRLTFHARLNAPDDPPPSPSEALRVKVSASRPFVRDVRNTVQMERLPAEEKQPLITSTEDTELELSNVLSNTGVLRLIGKDLFFDRKDPDCGCVIRGTRSGSALQNRFASISNAEILLVPDIPPQEEPWNNEYTVSVSTQYTEHGTLRTGTYSGRLRTPLEIADFTASGMDAGILTGSAASPYVTVTGGTLNMDSMVRIQAMLDPKEGHLLCSLLSPKRQGARGDLVSVRENGDYVLPGYTGSVLSMLNIRVNDYAALLDLVRNSYSGRLVDILHLKKLIG